MSFSPALVTALGKHCTAPDAALVVDSLSVGMTRVRDLFLRRIHEDVEQDTGLDSLITPLSDAGEERQTQNAELEVEIYSMIVVADEVTRGGYVDRPQEWLLEWLFELRLGSQPESLFRQRVDAYQHPKAEARRLQFLRLLQQAMPESARTPLVLFRLFPRALRIVAAVPFGDQSRVQELREEQCRILPAITDCFECHGRVLDNEDVCHVCGNPVWEFKWLKSD